MNKNKDTNNNPTNNFKAKQVKKRNKAKIIILLACVFLIYCIILFIKLVKNPTETFIVEQGKIYKEESVTGYILRDEQIVENDTSAR